MMKNCRKILYFLIFTLLFSAMLPMTVSADMGPKPSVRVTFKNLGDELCYGTLLSEESSIGPNSVWDGNEEHIYSFYDLDLDIWRAFVEYEDEDGYYFLQSGWKVSETKEIAWTYYPPQRFKILLYYPETGKFAVSGVCERYAFDSYYTVDLEGADDSGGELSLNAYRSYQRQEEALSFAARVLLTIAIEMGVALLFGFRGKKALGFLAAVNAATQIILNVLLNVIDFRSGPAAFAAGYILLELAVFAIEALLYSVWLKKLDDRAKPARFYVVYALAANAASFGAGLIIAEIIPDIF